MKRVVGGVETWQVYGIGGELLTEYTSNGTQLSKEYGYRNGELLITATVTTGWGSAPTLADNPLQAGVTAVKAQHISELRNAINSLRAHMSMSPYSWQYSATTSDYINANPILEMRTALDQALGAPGSGYAAGLAQGQPIKAIHIQELRDRVLAAWVSESSTDVRWLVTDHLGTPRMIFDQTGSLANVSRHDYLPFGEELFAGTGGRTMAQGYTSSDNVRQKFTGKERDNETGLDYFVARYYASTQGRFTSADDFLNDTHVDSPASWNLYTFVRNNPLKYIDPFGEKVFGTDLTDKERQKLIDDWKKKTGYKDVQFKDGKLAINVEAGRSGGSAKAADQLLAAVNSTSIRFNLASVDSTKIAFGQVDGGTTILGADGKKTRTDYKVSIDFGDFDRAGGDKEAKEAYSIGIVTIHEFDHRVYDIRDYPNGKSDPGPLERTYINPIRQELGLPERLHYASEPLSGAYKNFYPGGGQQIRFKLAGKERVLRWQTNLVGGKVE